MKQRLSFLIIILSCNLSVFAQNKTVDALVNDFQRSRSLTLAYIDAMPEEGYTFRPTEEIRTYSEQLLHLAQGTIGLCGNGTGKARIYPNENLEKNKSYQSKAEVKRIVTESFDFAIDGIKNMDPTTFDEIVQVGSFNVTRLGWINKAFEHITHHRGQCAIYLRLSGITPPQYQLF